jgi:hypothetical protein
MIIDTLLNYKEELILLAWCSALLLIVSIAIIPWIIIKIPYDYFHESFRIRISERSEHPLFVGLLTGIKNAVGLVLVILGILMLILPGQGILTILVGLFLMDFPGKYKIERNIVSYPKVLKSLNWIRAKANQPPLMI